MKKLATYVEKNHLKSDKDSPQFGMVYEYVDTAKIGRYGQWLQGEALDTMHDGAWYAMAMSHAFRATGDAYYRDFLTKYQVPFYTNMLNHSDELFADGLKDAKLAPTNRRFEKSHRYAGEKGFVPYWWDDGASMSIELEWQKLNGKHPYECVDYDALAKKDQSKFALNGFSLGCSNHMAQDLAVMLMDTWLVLREDRIAEAAMNLNKSRTDTKAGAVPMCKAAAGLTNGDATLLAGVGPGAWEPGRDDYTYSLYAYDTDKPRTAPGFVDGQMYDYHMLVARDGGLTRETAMHVIYPAVTLPWLYRYWWDGRGAPAGFNRDEHYSFAFANGRPEPYRSLQPKWAFGSRMGPQTMVLTALALQALKAFPDAWEDRYHKQFADDLLVRIASKSPDVDGVADDTYSKPVEASGMTARVVMDHKGFYVQGAARTSAWLSVFSLPDGKGRETKIRINREGDASVVNYRSQDMLYDKSVVKGDGDAFTFEVYVPFTVINGQQEWLNGVEHGRYSLAVGTGEPRNFYAMSTREDVEAALLNELTVGLSTWRDVVNDSGFVPLSLGQNLGHYNGATWDTISESGGYAHLISAASQYLLYLDGKTDWQVQDVPKVAK